MSDGNSIRSYRGLGTNDRYSRKALLFIAGEYMANGIA